MTPRVIAIGLALLANVLLATAAPGATLVWVHPIAPPLTHIPGAGETVLAGSAATPPAPPSPPPGAPPGAPLPMGPPPLRGVAGALEQVVRAHPTPASQAAVGSLRAASQGVFTRAARGAELRLAIQDHAVALASALGPARVGAVARQKDQLSTTIGEGRAWQAAIAAVEAP